MFLFVKMPVTLDYELDGKKKTISHSGNILRYMQVGTPACPFEGTQFKSHNFGHTVTASVFLPRTERKESLPSFLFVP